MSSDAFADDSGPKLDGVPREKSKRKSLEQARLRREFKRIAYRVDQQRYIYAVYGLLDGLNIAYSTLKYFFDMYLVDTNLSASDEMHTWTITPEGIAVAAFESICLIVFSMLANYFKEEPYELCWLSGVEDVEIENKKLYLEFVDGNQLRYKVKNPSGEIKEGFIMLDALVIKDKNNEDKKLADIGVDKITLAELRDYLPAILAITSPLGHTKHSNLFKKYLAYIWPYCRDVLKAFKSTSKGFRSLLTTVFLLGGQNLITVLMLPVALALGVMTSLNRLWYRKMKNKRKDDQDENALLRKEILAKKCITEEEVKIFCERMKQMHSPAQRRKAMASSFFAGLTDGLYLYMGVFALAPITGPFFIVLSAFSALYVLLSIVSRMYEESDYQNKLTVSMHEVELALLIKQLQTKLQGLEELLDSQKKLRNTAATENDFLVNKQKISALLNEIETKKLALLECRKKIENLTVLSFMPALLAGLRQGLIAYGVIASLLFALGTALLLASVAFPPALLFAGVALGMVCLIVFTVHSLRVNYRYQQESKGLALMKFTEHENPLTCTRDALKKKLNGRDAVILFNDELYHANHMTNTAKKIQSGKNGADYQDLKEKCASSYKLADEQDLAAFKALTGLTRKKVEDPFSEMNDLLARVERVETSANDIQAQAEQKSIADAFAKKAVEVDASPRNFFQEIAEMLRSFFSGMAKGSKAVDFTLNPLQEMGNDGHYRASAIMVMVTWVFAAIYSIGLTIRAYFKGFGAKEVIDPKKPSATTPEVSLTTESSSSFESFRAHSVVVDTATNSAGPNGVEAKGSESNGMGVSPTGDLHQTPDTQESEHSVSPAMDHFAGGTAINFEKKDLTGGPDETMQGLQGLKGKENSVGQGAVTQDISAKAASNSSSGFTFRGANSHSPTSRNSSPSFFSPYNDASPTDLSPLEPVAIPVDSTWNKSAETFPHTNGNGNHAAMVV